MGCFCCIAQKWQNRRAIFEAHFIGHTAAADAVLEPLGGNYAVLP
jgi:hypothetical protein